MINRRAMPLAPLVGLGAYFVASIFYLLPSGTPQPADYFLLIMVLLTFVFAWRGLPTERLIYFAVGLLIAWIVLVNGVWFMVTSEFQFLQKTTYYLFNALAFVFVVACGEHDFRRTRTVLRWSCIAALFLQLASLQLVEPTAGSRAIGTFNNPNQLGYWALLAMACLAVAKDRAHLDVWDVLALSVGTYLTVLSASRAATISAIVLIALIVFSRGFDRKSGIVAAGALALAVFVQLVGGGLVSHVAETEPVSRLTDRFDRQDEDEVLDRGYLRLVEHPEYIIFGAGEGAFARFADERGAREFHSSLGNVLLSYGMVGLGLFGFLLFTVLRRAPWPSVAYVLPVMLYGITHMGLRFTPFWVFLALVYTQGRHRPRGFGVRRSGRHGGRSRWRRRRRPRIAAPAAPAAPSEASEVEDTRSYGRSIFS